MSQDKDDNNDLLPYAGFLASIYYSMFGQTHGKYVTRGTGGGETPPEEPTEYVTDGDFPAGSLGTSWTNDSTGTGTASIVNEELVLTRSGSAGNEGRASQVIVDLPAGDYSLSWDGIAGTVRWSIQGSFPSVSPVAITHAGGNLTIQVRATNTGGTIDNVSLVEAA